MSTIAPTPARPTLLDLVKLPGTQRVPVTVQVANPAVGLDWSQQVPGGVVWRVETIFATYTASAAVSTRIPQIVLTDGNNIIFRRGAISGVTANVVQTLSWARLCTANEAVAGVSTVAYFFPDLRLPGGFFIRTTTIAKDAGDQWSTVTLFVTELRPPVDADWGALGGGAGEVV